MQPAGGAWVLCSRQKSRRAGEDCPGNRNLLSADFEPDTVVGALPGLALGPHGLSARKVLI